MEAILDILDCPICMRPIDFALFCPECATNFCRPCIKEHTQRANDRCPFCKTACPKWPINKFYNNIAEIVKVPCNECGYTYKLSELREHMVKCEVDIFDCKYCKKITKKKHECVIIDCPMCGQIIEKDKIRNHCQKECPNYLITCPNCQYKYPKDVNHTCINAKISCEWCQESFPLKEIGDHRMVCEHRIVICNWCKCQYKLTEKHNCKMVECHQCHGMITVTTLSQHYKQCVAKNKYCKYCHFYFPDLDTHEMNCSAKNGMEVCNVCHLLVNGPNHFCKKCNECKKYYIETPEFHYQHCDKVPISCKFCGQGMIRQLMTSHLNFKCPSKPVMCRQCGKFKSSLGNSRSKICRDCLQEGS